MFAQVLASFIKSNKWISFQSFIYKEPKFINFPKSLNTDLKKLLFQSDFVLFTKKLWNITRIYFKIGTLLPRRFILGRPFTNLFEIALKVPSMSKVAVINEFLS